MISSVRAPGSISFVVISVGSIVSCIMIASLFINYNPTGFTFNSKVSEQGQAIVQDDLFSFVAETPAFAPTFAQTLSSDDLQEVEIANSSVSINGYDSKETDVVVPSVSVDKSGRNSSRIDGSALSSPPSEDYEKSNLKVCDLYPGKWVYNPAGPLYTSHTCPIIVQSQNCQGNGRPDKDYENWRWRPNQCEIPRFDGRKFLELMRGKTLAFVGDSLARNQMDSLLCILWQTEVPINRGNHQMDKWYFQSTSTTIARMWSAWLVHITPISSSSSSSSSRAVNVHIDTPDNTITNFLHSFDVLILSSGHWFSAESSYLLNNTIVGGRFSHAKKAQKRKDIIKFYGMTIQTAVTAVANFNYTGLTILRSYSPEHYEGGDWDTGGSCKKVNKPARKSVRSGYVNEMYKQQVENFESVVRKVKNGAKLRFMDITEMSGYRNDGHAGIYSGQKARKKKAAEDCVHWCMPGIADSWNEVLFEILKREL